MKEEDIYNDILSKYPEEKVLAFCTDAICKRFNSSIKALGEGKPEIATGALGESSFYLNLLKKLSEKKSSGDKETIVVA